MPTRHRARAGYPRIAQGSGIRSARHCCAICHNGLAAMDRKIGRQPWSHRGNAFFWPFFLCAEHPRPYYEEVSLGGGVNGLWGAGGASGDACVSKGTASGRRWHVGISVRSWVDVPIGSRQAPRNRTARCGCQARPARTHCLQSKATFHKFDTLSSARLATLLTRDVQERSHEAFP